MPGSGRKEQGRATGLSRTAPALEGTRSGVQGDRSRAGSTPGLADPRAGVCRGNGPGEGHPSGQLIPEQRDARTRGRAEISRLPWAGVTGGWGG